MPSLAGLTQVMLTAWMADFLWVTAGLREPNTGLAVGAGLIVANLLLGN